MSKKENVFSVVTFDPEINEVAENIVACAKSVSFGLFENSSAAAMQAVGHCLYKDQVNNDKVSDDKDFPVNGLALGDKLMMYTSPIVKENAETLNPLATIVFNALNKSKYFKDDEKGLIPVFGKAVITGRGNERYSPVSLDVDEFMEMLNSITTELQGCFSIQEIKYVPKNKYGANFSEN